LVTRIGAARTTFVVMSKDRKAAANRDVRQISRTIEQRILLIRGHRVRLDHDLAELYGVPTGTLNQAVARNTARFPSDFAFKLSAVEAANLMSQSVISSSHGGRRKSPHVFTEQGVAMLSSVLRSRRAVDVNIAIMRAFVHLRGATCSAFRRRTKKAPPNT
jgi:hypothetical protein